MVRNWARIKPRTTNLIQTVNHVEWLNVCIFPYSSALHFTRKYQEVEKYATYYAPFMLTHTREKNWSCHYVNTTLVLKHIKLRIFTRLSLHFSLCHFYSCKLIWFGNQIMLNIHVHETFVFAFPVTQELKSLSFCHPSLFDYFRSPVHCWLSNESNVSLKRLMPICNRCTTIKWHELCRNGIENHFAYQMRNGEKKENQNGKLAEVMEALAEYHSPFRKRINVHGEVRHDEERNVLNRRFW